MTSSLDFCHMSDNRHSIIREHLVDSQEVSYDVKEISSLFLGGRLPNWQR